MTLLRRIINLIHGRTTKIVDGREITFAGRREAHRAMRAVARQHHKMFRKLSQRRQ